MRPEWSAPGRRGHPGRRDRRPGQIETWLAEVTPDQLAQTAPVPDDRWPPYAKGRTDFLLDLESRWDVVRFLGAHPATMSAREDALASIARRRAVEHPIHGIWAITTTADGRPVGNLLLKPIPLSAGEPPGRPPDVEIGWHLHPDAWGLGYATEAAEAVLDDAFSRGLTRVIAVSNPDNLASQAVCRWLGMTHLGRTTRYYDAPHELFEKLPRVGHGSRT